MKCLRCQGEKSRVEETRRVDAVVWRKRVCLKCGRKRWTQETYSLDDPPINIHNLNRRRANRAVDTRGA